MTSDIRRVLYRLPCIDYKLNVTCVAKQGASARWTLLLSRHEFTVCQKIYFDFSGAVTE
ncbi:hypothetical protein CH1034_250353 [Klebsiella pneumoniae]|nr:hypothetical protein SB4536_1720036 [Klebsiella pneumoniae subsp. pneumoniae T69]CTQ29225.1 hypothetical protein CH1034_250353 [Klebsiella pneumoniae]SAL90942.1 conserved hypothetical protein [Klebsiella pneumoniae]SBM97427.1 conserved hypothetical protein [Klebsiella pneumoniae]